MKEKDYFTEDPDFLTPEGRQVRICFDIEHIQEEQVPYEGGEPVLVDVIKAYCCRVDHPLTYERVSSELIRQFYTVDEEFSIQRQKDDKVSEYNTYNAWIEKLKYIARRVVEGDTLDTFKGMKLAELGLYDASPAVNSFTIGNKSTWISPAKRTNYLLTVQAAQAAGVETVVFEGITLPVADALAALNAINIYAMKCVAVTEGHKAAINAKRSIKTVEEYDFTTGYPEKLSF